MPHRHVVVALTVALVLFGIAASPSFAGEPPNQNDPCSTNGKDSCGTLGVGYYKTYSFGVRWFGDYRGAVEGVPHTFCIDLQYWYPGVKYRYAESTSSTLTNRDGEPVPAGNLQRMAYALWHYGQSTDPDQQAATMLYVHSLMGDARPGEVDANAIGSKVAAIVRRMSTEAAELHGPYHIEAKLPDRIDAGAKGTMTFRVISATGAAVPGITLELQAKGATGVPAAARTNDQGIATVSFTATDSEGVDVTATTEKLASTLPRIFVPTDPAAAINGQRLAAPASQIISTGGGVGVSKSKIQATTKATASALLVGQPLRDKVFVTGASETWRGTIEARLYGPFHSQDAIRCDGDPFWTGTIDGHGPGTYTTSYAHPRQIGWYGFQETITGDSGNVGFTTECRDPAEIFKVETQPVVETIVSADRIIPGTDISDTIKVSKTAGEKITIRADLFGPFASRDAIACDGQPIWTGNVDAAGDGEVMTTGFPLTVPGYYTYRESVAATEFTRATDTRCGDEAETTIVAGQPKILTQVSAAVVAPGTTLSDTAIITGLGALNAVVNVELWGPFQGISGISCQGTPYWKGTFVAKGDGTYKTRPIAIAKVGYYTFRESIDEAPPYDGVTTKCGDSAETSLASSEPLVTTLVSNEVVAPGTRISDRIKVSGLGQTAAKIEVELYGPFATRAAISCTTRPIWTGTVFVKGDGEITSPQVKLARAGFYAYREKLVGSKQIKGMETDCAEVSETSLARPLIITGRNETTRLVAGTDAGGRTPVEIDYAGLNIAARISPSAIDLKQGVLAVPADIHRTGWWSDGAAPGATTGAVLVAGHVDSAKAGAGAFYRLKEARVGDTIQVVSRDKTTTAYKVVSIKTVPKAALPTDVFSLQGGPRLVLVTCGGPFDKTVGHYRDNVIVTAVPA